MLERCAFFVVHVDCAEVVEGVNGYFENGVCLRFCFCLLLVS